MDDLISRAAAINALGEEPPVWYDGEDEIAERNQWRRDVAAIKALSPAQPGWIPCSVMLPENDGVYLVTLRAITQLQKACAKIDIARFDGKWHKAYPVVAWMPLPKPWEGDANG